MASGGGIRSFYRERKKTATIAGGVAKPSAATSKKNKGTAAVKFPPAASVGGGDSQPPALISHGSLDLDAEAYGPEEAALQQFDMDMRYGPCLGMTRLERWERAARLGLHPPAELEGLLLRRQEAGGGGAPVVNLECVWEGRI